MRNNLYLEKVTNTIAENMLKEASTSGDLGQFQDLALPLVKKIYPQTLISQIADIQAIKAPYGRIAALHTYYSPDSSVQWDNCLIVSTDVLGLAVGTPIVSSGGGTGVVVYVEENRMLIRLTLGTIYVGETLNGTNVVRTVSLNRTAIKKMFHNYGAGIELATPRKIHSVVRTMTVETKSRKLQTGFSLEQIQDLKNIYGEDSNEIISETLKTEIIQEIDMEAINFIRDIATPMPDLVLQNSYGTQGDMMAIGNDIFVNIFYATESIAKATRRNRTMFVIADSATLALLLTNPLHTKVDKDDDNPFYVGKLGGTIKMYNDMYAEDHYILIGYRGSGRGDGDTGIIYCPYTNDLISAQDADTFENKFMMMSRYAIARHPQDQGNGIGDSDFFRVFNVDMSNITNYVP